MRKLSVILALLALAAAPVSAQIDPTPDGIGIYADLGGMQAGVHQEAGVPLEVYLLLTNPSSNLPYSAWQCGIEAPDNARIWGFSFPQAGTLAFVDEPNFLAAWGEFIPLQTVNLLMTFIITPLDDHCAYFNVTDYDWGQRIESPGYLVEGDLIIDLNPYASPLGATFALNVDNQLPTDDATLDEVKALFR